jgi:hypothetical protein
MGWRLVAQAVAFWLPVCLRVDRKFDVLLCTREVR